MVVSEEEFEVVLQLMMQTAVLEEVLQVVLQTALQTVLQVVLQVSNCRCHGFLPLHALPLWSLPPRRHGQAQQTRPSLPL